MNENTEQGGSLPTDFTSQWGEDKIVWNHLPIKSGSFLDQSYHSYQVPFLEKAK